MDTATRYTVMREDLSLVLAREYGDVNDSATILAAIIDIGARPCTLVLTDDVTGTWLLDVDVTIPSHVTLSIPMGVTVTGTANLTIQGGLLALRVDWFQSTGTLIWLGGAGVFQATQLHAGPTHLAALTLDTPLALDQGGTGARDAPQARINLGLVLGVNVQPYDATLAAFAALNGAANQMVYFTGPDAFGVFNASIYSMALLGNTNSANWLAGLGCGDLAPLDTVSTVQIDDRAVTLPKLQTLQAARLIGRQAGSVGPAQEISLGSGLAMSTGGVLDLSGTAIAGTGADNRVGIWSGVGSQTYDDMLIWDRTNRRLGIGTGTPTERLHVFGNIMTPNSVFAQDGVFPKYVWVQDAAGNTDYAGNPAYAISAGLNYVGGQTRYNLNIGGTAHNYIAGNVGLGVLNPIYKLDVNGQARVTNLGVNCPPDATWQFALQGNFVMSGGRMGIGGTPDASYALHVYGAMWAASLRSSNGIGSGMAPAVDNGADLRFNGGVGWGIRVWTYGSDNTWAMAIQNYAGSVIGTISTSATAVAYNTTSDRRLKRNIQALPEALATVARLRPIRFLWNSTDTPDQGFLADEVQAIIPAAVEGEPDALNPDGTMRPQQMDHSKLVPWLVGAVQELTQRLQVLEGMLEGGI